MPVPVVVLVVGAVSSGAGMLASIAAFSVSVGTLMSYDRAMAAAEARRLEEQARSDSKEKKEN